MFLRLNLPHDAGTIIVNSDHVMNCVSDEPSGGTLIFFGALTITDGDTAEPYLVHVLENLDDIATALAAVKVMR